MKMSSMIPGGLLSLLAGLCMFAGAARAEEGPWQTDFEAAKAQAKAEKKILLVDFTGSDWCGFCIKLRDEVFAKEPFKSDVSKQFVLVELDYPRQKQLPDDLKAQNDKLKKEYKVSGFPTICLLDAEGQVIAKFVGFGPGTGEKYLAKLGSAPKVWENVLKMKAELAGVQGLERAKLLDQLYEAYDKKLSNPVDDLPVWSKEIVVLDADNKAGLKNKYVCKEIVAEATKLGAVRNYAEAVTALEKALALEDLAGDQKQEVLFKLGTFQYSLKDFAAALATMKQAAAADAKGELIAQIKNMTSRITMIVEGQAKLAKDMEELPQTQGLDRAKLMDKIIEANAKLQMAGGAKLTPDEIAKWTAEIVELDKDNAAGLKNKYEFSKLVREAGQLARDKKFEEGLAAIDKALAISGITPAQTQEGLMAKGMNYFAQKDYDKCLDLLKQAVEAAPKTMRAMQINNIYIKSIEQMKKKAAAQPI